VTIFNQQSNPWVHSAMIAGETELQMCIRHVAEQEMRIDRQEVLVKRLQESGSALSEDALKLLDSMQDLLGDMRAHVARLS
jgi:hypothetical protein